MSEPQDNSRHSGARAGDPRRWRVVATAAVVGGLAVFLGMSQFMAGLHLGPQDETLREIAAGKPVTAPMIRRTAESREAALNWVASGQALSELATLRLSAIASVRVLSPERRRIAADAIALQRRALMMSPADAYGWARLVQGRAISAAPVRTLEPELRMAASRAPTESNLLAVRINVALLYWGGLSDGLRAQTAREARHAARFSPELLATLARARGLEAEVVRMLADDPVAAARFQWMRARLEERGR